MTIIPIRYSKIKGVSKKKKKRLFMCMIFFLPEWEYRKELNDDWI